MLLAISSYQIQPSLCHCLNLSGVLLSRREHAFTLGIDSIPILHTPHLPTLAVIIPTAYAPDNSHNKEQTEGRSTSVTVPSGNAPSLQTNCHHILWISDQAVDSKEFALHYSMKVIGPCSETRFLEKQLLREQDIEAQLKQNNEEGRKAYAQGAFLLLITI